MTESELQAVMLAVGVAVKEHTAGLVCALNARIDALASKSSGAGPEIKKEIESLATRLARQDVLMGALTMSIGHRGVPQENLGALERLEKRLVDLEARSMAIRYCGVWDAQTQYNEGEFVTDHGSMYHCNRSTRQRPGTGSDFTLCVKRGQSAKESGKR